MNNYLNNKRIDFYMRPTKEFITRITKEAGKNILTHFGKISVKYTKKNEGDVVTQADLDSEKILVNAIKKEYPGQGIISEESEDYNTDSEYVWVIDPLDGTRNFSTNTPFFGVIVGVMKNKEMIMSCIYLPYMDEIYYAEKGKGAYLNDQKIRCSEKEKINSSYGIVNTSKNIDLIDKLKRKYADQGMWTTIIICGALTFSYVSSGRRDWQITKNSSLWDIAPGVLLCEEAGCKVTFTDGSKFDPFKKGNLIIANKNIHEQILNISKETKD